MENVQTEHQAYHPDVLKTLHYFWTTHAPCAACEDSSTSLCVCFGLFALDRPCVRSLASSVSHHLIIRPQKNLHIQGCVSLPCLRCKFYSFLTLVFLPPMLPSPSSAKWRQRSCFSPPLVWWLSEWRPMILNSLQTLKNVPLHLAARSEINTSEYENHLLMNCWTHVQIDVVSYLNISKWATLYQISWYNRLKVKSIQLFDNREHMSWLVFIYRAFNLNRFAQWGRYHCICPSKGRT